MGYQKFRSKSLISQFRIWACALHLLIVHSTLLLRGYELTEGEKGQIIAYYAVGKSRRWIGAELGRSVSTIRNVIDRVKERNGSLHNAPRTGKPKALTDRSHRALVRSASGSPEKTNTSIGLEQQCITSSTSQYSQKIAVRCWLQASFTDHQGCTERIKSSGQAAVVHSPSEVDYRGLAKSGVV